VHANVEPVRLLEDRGEAARALDARDLDAELCPVWEALLGRRKRVQVARREPYRREEGAGRLRHACGGSR
jgi:hypothetical protein